MRKVRPEEVKELSLNPQKGKKGSEMDFDGGIQMRYSSWGRKKNPIIWVE